ncbi:Radical SAM domain protein [Olavius sp. associated proteobacterium Delta 1]|nr:Radical SAM domain protein [Olavius sp. associated proteobacterium Delta 1]
MRVLLINPYYPISETPSPPLGLAYLASALCEAGIEVKILDLVVYPYSQTMLQNVLEKFQPQLVGLTAVTMTFDNGMGVIRDIKRLNPDILSVMGGPHVTFCTRETLKKHSELDMLVLGEGERTIVDLCRAVDTGSDWDGVNGIAYRKHSEICHTAPRDPIADLDELPDPARGLLPLGRYRALGMPISLTTSRGCPFKCIFCVGRKMVGSRVRYRSPGNVVDELEYVNSLNFHQINIADDLFTANRKHCLAVCDEIVDRRLELRWTSFARVDTVSEEILARMKAAGCSAVSFGIESGNPQILKTIKKGITREQVVEAVDMCRRSGITPHASFILGLPGETRQTIRQTLDFGEQLKELGLSFGFHLLAPFPGTEIRENSDQYGIKILTDDWSEYHANRAIVETPGVDRQTLDKIVIGWEDEYTLLLADIQQRMLKEAASAQEADQVNNLERIVLVYDLMMKNVIEQNGSWPHAGQPLSTEDTLKILSDKISTELEARPQLIRDTLIHALHHGDLICQESGNTIRWQWVDYI